MSQNPKQNRNENPELNCPVNKTLNRRQLLTTGLTFSTALMLPSLAGAQAERSRLKRVPAQYIAALGDPGASSGNNAQEWGLWRLDPGPRGVRLRDYDRLQARGGVAPANWTFDNQDWWLEENGLIMEQPEFPLPPGLYQVTGDREVVSILTVHEKAADGSQQWQLADNASIYDVTHLRCRSGRYTPLSAGSCTPAQAKQSDFPVTPGAEMPPVAGCHKQDYAVFIVTAVGML